MSRPPNLIASTTAPKRAPKPAETAPPADYLDLYGLSKPPFGEKLDSSGYILFAPHRRAFEVLTDHMVSGSGLLVLQGVEGVGKTETLRATAAIAAESRARTIVVSRPPGGRISLTQLISAIRGSPGTHDATADQAISDFSQQPRKVLVADDVELMPQECVNLVLALAQSIPKSPGGPAIVLSSSADLAAVPNRPELSQLAGLARNTVRMLTLGPAEIRQYIERSLWIAGGTTRRLITPDATKLLIARSGGVPGTVNRLMEAAFMAGFARGDPMITAKTMAAALGPTASRPKPQSNVPPDIAGRAVQIIAAGLLVTGASAFLYKGLSGKFERPVPPLVTAPIVPPKSPPNPPAPVSTPTPSPPSPPVTKPAEVLPSELVAALMKRGEQSLNLGDIAAARLLFQRAAETGNANAATALAKTYDPNFVASGGVADPARAAEWYRKALIAGDTHAADLLKKLSPH